MSRETAGSWLRIHHTPPSSSLLSRIRTAHAELYKILIKTPNSLCHRLTEAVRSREARLNTACGLLPVSGGKGHVVLCVRQMPRPRPATDESKMSVTPTLTRLHNITDLRHWFFLPYKGANDGELGMGRNMPGRCPPPPLPLYPPSRTIWTTGNGLITLEAQKRDGK
ncbi:hypothetical protein NQZ68_010622 [Dissostichus eleginoides]|nr:hypothetical protein NQZ68_010622 [Dissostichus eleginoides]